MENETTTQAEATAPVLEKYTALQMAARFASEKRAGIEAEIDRVQRVAEMVPALTGLYFSIAWDSVRGTNGVNIWPDDENESRKTVGALIRALGIKPVFRKWDDAQAEARFELDGLTIMVNKYKGRNCRIVHEDVVLPAEPEKIIPAKPERTEKRAVMKCDTDEPEAPAAEQVPY